MKTWCHVDKLSMMTTASCRGVTVLPIEYFYPVHWLKWELLFSNMSKPEDFGGSLAAHLWNKFSHSLPVIKDSNQLYNLLAKENCPHVYTVIEKEF
jgi:Alpha 1,4-glycosyltransferase conserved region